MIETTKPDRGRLVLKNGLVVSMDPAIGTRESCDIAIDNGQIVDVGPNLHLDGAREVDASDKLVIPGLIDSHFHMWSCVGRTFITDGFEYFPAKWATSAHYEPEDFYNSVLLGLVEAANAGITTVHNWSHNTRSPEHADAELAAHRDGLLRARYAYGHRDLLPEDEPLDFTDIDRVRDQWFSANSPFEGTVHLGVNLRGPDLSDLDTFHTEMKDVRARNLPVAIHTVQGGSTKVRARDLADHGYLGRDFLICHFLAATAEDRAIMAETGTSLSYSVHSELRLGDAGDPRAALLSMVRAGVNVSLSIDATSLHPVNLFEAMNVAWNMGIPWQGTETESLSALTLHECLAMATINGARALGIDDVTGSLTPGKRADVVLLRKHDLNLAPVVEPESAVVRAATPANVDTVIIDGRIIKEGGRLLHVDPATVVRNAEESARRILKRSRESKP
jgi:cytosine/adenosine deaminase-related metal-dependent hydrolase